MFTVVLVVHTKVEAQGKKSKNYINLAIVMKVSCKENGENDRKKGRKKTTSCGNSVSRVAVFRRKRRRSLVHGVGVISSHIARVCDALFNMWAYCYWLKALLRPFPNRLSRMSMHLLPHSAKSLSRACVCHGGWYTAAIYRVLSKIYIYIPFPVLIVVDCLSIIILPCAVIFRISEKSTTLDHGWLSRPFANL